MHGGELVRRTGHLSIVWVLKSLPTELNYGNLCGWLFFNYCELKKYDYDF